MEGGKDEGEFTVEVLKVEEKVGGGGEEVKYSLVILVLSVLLILIVGICLLVIKRIHPRWWRGRKKEVKG